MKHVIPIVVLLTIAAFFASCNNDIHPNSSTTGQSINNENKIVVDETDYTKSVLFSSEFAEEKEETKNTSKDNNITEKIEIEDEEYITSTAEITVVSSTDLFENNTKLIECDTTMEVTTNSLPSGVFISENNKVYYLLGETQRQKYCIKNTIASEQEVGDYFGIVTKCRDESLVGNKVYHCSAYPDNDSIVLVFDGNNYVYYCSY